MGFGSRQIWAQVTALLWCSHDLDRISPPPRVLGVSAVKERKERKEERKKGRKKRKEGRRKPGKKGMREREKEIGRETGGQEEGNLSFFQGRHWGEAWVSDSVRIPSMVLGTKWIFRNW